jgi:REP-associated tyrosine transposase
MRSASPHSRHLRKGRYSESGHYYFLTTCVAGRRPIFTAPERAAIVLGAIRWLHVANRFLVHAAVVMPDHLHFAGELAEGTLPALMQALKGYSAHRLARMGIETPVWQDGYHDHALRDDEDYAMMLRYLIDNPVRAGLAARAEDYPHVILPDWWAG